MAKKPEILISELFLESASNRQNLIRVFNFEIPSGATHTGGSIFGVIKIDSIHPVYERFIEGFLDSVEKFYQEEHSLEFEAEFEKSLQVINKGISDFIAREANPVDLSKLNILIAANTGETLSFSGVGEIQTVFFQKQTAKGYQVFELTKNIRSDKEKINPAKLFENVMYGSIKPGDVILVANPELLADFPQEEMQPIITTRKPAEAVEHLRDKLLSENIKGGYTAIIIKYHEEVVPVGTEADKRNFQGSLQHLEATKAETSRYLIGGGGNVVTKVLSSVTASITSIFPKTGPKYEEKIAPEPKEIPQKIVRFFVWLGALIAKTTIGIGRFFKNSFIFLTNYGGGRKEVIESYQTDIKGAADRGTGWFNNLGKINKSVFIVILIIVLIFVWSIIYINYRNNKKEADAVYNAQVIEITQKKDEAESSLIYGDEDRARELVEEALALAMALPDKKKDQRQIRQELIDDIEKLKQDLRHVVIPTDLKKLADLPLGDQGESLSFKFYLASSPDKYLILNENKTLFAWQNTEQAWQKVDWENEQIQTISTLVKSDDDEYIIIDGRPGVSEVNIVDLSWQEVDFSVAEEQRQFTSLSTWNRHLYILDPEAGQIFRHRYSSSGYEGGSGWIQSATMDLNNAVSITIDGNIFVLKSTGEVYKFYTGVRQSWAPSNVDPAFSGPSKIWTDENNDYLYILEPIQNRVVVLEKESGNLKNQYLLDGLNNIQDFYIDTSSRKIRVLADNGVWEFGYKE